MGINCNETITPLAKTILSEELVELALKLGFTGQTLEDLAEAQADNPQLARKALALALNRRRAAIDNNSK